MCSRPPGLCSAAARGSTTQPPDYDYAVIGSGFGGSVAALRLAQKGYRVAVLEMGRRWGAAELPTSNWQARRYLWLPELGCFGLQRMDFMRHLLAVRGVGVGGGSLIYGNTLFVPLDSFFARPIVQQLGGAAGLMPYFALAQRMMGVVPNPRLFEPDELLRATAEACGRGHTFAPSPVGVFFGEPEREVPDPYFLGQGPPRSGCSFCAGCFVGCRVGAKNSLDRNYLYLAEQLGAAIIPDTEVVAIHPLSADGSAGYALDTRRPGPLPRLAPARVRARGVVVAAGVLGTLGLLHRCRQRGWLPRLSARLGEQVRSNSETIIGVRARSRRVDYARGLAASSSVFPDPHTQVQADRYPAGSDFLALLSTLLVDGGGWLPRPLRLLGAVLRHPLDFLRSLLPWGFARQSMVLVCMQDHDHQLRVVRRRPWYWPFAARLATRRATAERPLAYLPEANAFARALAARMDGVALSTSSEVFLNAPASAHILGGCVMGETPEQGVVDLHGRAFGYQNLIVCDGSVVPANLGVNPALSILALAERTMAAVPLREGAEMRWLEVDRAWGVQELLQGAGDGPK